MSTHNAKRYIVKLKDDVPRDTHMQAFGQNIAAFSVANETAEGEPGAGLMWFSTVFHGYAGVLSEDTIPALRDHEHVEYIEEDYMMYACAMAEQHNARWGLERISKNAKLPEGSDPGALNFTYKYDSDLQGNGVDIYILDTGIHIQHNDFGSRASWGKTFIGSDTIDKVGHGTHCAGIAAGTTYGVAKAAKVIAVKVLGDDGKAPNSFIVKGLDWTVQQIIETGRPAVISMSLGGPANRALDDAVKKATDRGVHVVVAAGNDNDNANNYSPARAPSAITVGSVDISDVRAATSNYGSPVDVFAPGVKILSAWPGGSDSTNSISGTSMACPHVSGIVACLLSKAGGGSLKPAVVLTNLKEKAIKGILHDIPADTVNALVQNAV